MEVMKDLEICPHAEKLPMFDSIRGCKLKSWIGGPTGKSIYRMPCKQSNYAGDYQECPCYRES